MDTKKYAVLQKAAELGSLTRAAEELGLTQSAVSHILADLEQETGFRLMCRGRSGASLTPEGERLMPAVTRLLDAARALGAEAAGIRGQAAGTIRIGTFTSVAVHWLPGMMKEFQEANPLAEFRLFNGDYHDVQQWLADGSVDLAFAALPVDARCVCTPLLEDRLLAVLPLDHALAAGETCPVTEIAREPFISLLQASAHDALRAAEQAGVRLNVKYTTKDDYAIIAMVSQGLGVSIMPELLLEGRTESVAVRPLDPPSSRVIALAEPDPGSASPAARRFRDFVIQWVREHYPPASDRT